MKKNPFILILYIFKMIIIFTWLIISTVVYGVLCFLLCIPFRKFGRWITVIWARQLIFLSGVKVDVKGLRHLDPEKNYLFIANHLSYYDILALLAALPYPLNFVAKKSLFYIPIWGWACYLTGHIPIDRGHPKKARKSLEKASRTIKKFKRSIFGFPEGTRSRSGKMQPFKLGLFSLAIQTGIDVVPIAIHGTREISKPGSYIVWPGRIVLEITPPLCVQEYTQRSKNELSGKSWNIIHDLVEKEGNQE